MTDREKLIELLKAADRYEFEETRNSGVYDREAAWGYIADHLLANGVTFQKWIPVSERLPEPETDVLIFRYGCAEVMTYRYDRHGHLCFMDFDDSGYWWERKGITHWMPLPEPPQEE
jgi:hypothetical protein